MVTGDHLETAKSVAVATGILTLDQLDKEGYFMTGEQFRDIIGGYSRLYDSEINDYKIQFEDPSQFDKVKRNLRVLARCSAEDKYILVSGIKQKSGLIAMTGDSIADAVALKKADVGMCMGSGCEVAKDNSDLVILDNNFESMNRAIRWGRSIFDNVRKFIQFQLTINITICFVTVLGGLTLGHPPLNVIQMLWVNLIMDALGAIAIGTEPYRKDQSTPSSRIRRTDKIILTEMWRQVMVQALYQIVVMIILMYFGQMIFFTESFSLIYTPLRNADGGPTNRLVLDTICFHTFILMNLFNQINCRVIEADEVNVFKTFLNNPIFLIVLGAEILFQQLMINAGYSTLGSALLGTAPMTKGMEITCWVFGALSLAVNVGLKKIPIEKFEIFRRLIDLESDDDNQDFISRQLAKGEQAYQKNMGKVMNAGA